MNLLNPEGAGGDGVVAVAVHEVALAQQEVVRLLARVVGIQAEGARTGALTAQAVVRAMASAAASREVASAGPATSNRPVPAAPRSDEEETADDPAYR